MADISLTASMRSNLLSLQQTQSLMDMTQERLSTGKKVNSAIDNPSSYYTSQSLTNRANDLSALLDSMGQGIQTIKAANEGIETITSFAQQAKAMANTARDVAGNFDQYAITSAEIEPYDAGPPATGGITGDVFVDARKDLTKFTLDLDDGDATKQFTVYDSKGNGTTITLAGADTDAVRNDAITKLQGLGLNAKLDGTSIEVSSTDGSAVSFVDVDLVTDNSAQAAVKVSLAAAGNGATSASIAAAIDTAAAGLGIDAEASGRTLSITATDRQFRVFGDATNAASSKAVADMAIAGTRKAGDSSVEKAERTSYAAQFNEILSQIDQLAKDSGYKGVNLLQENDLKVVFNEDRTSTLDVTGVDASSKGLGLIEAQGNWQKNADIEKAVEQIDGAISKLRTYAADFGTNYSVVQNREDFTDSIVNVLTEGSDKLTLADMNEESANMLALQTRQQLAINSLSLASQAAQSVLKLFG